jgi:CHAD domain-containing protein
MAFRLRKNESVNAGIKRVAREQIDRALAEASSHTLTDARKVHQLRKRCKKLRGLIRLVRDSFDTPRTYTQENERIRNAAQILSSTRDADVMIETHDACHARFAPHGDFSRFSFVRDHLIAHRDRARAHRDPAVTNDGPTGNDASYETRPDTLPGPGDDVSIRPRLALFVEEMQQLRGRVDSWTFSDRGFRAVRQGLQRTYRRGRRMLYRAYADQSPEGFHEWRKRVKYHRYHCRLLIGVWPAVLTGRWKEAVRLSDFLGEEHDCTVLLAHVHAQADRLQSTALLDEYRDLVCRRRSELREAARWVGKRMYVDSPGVFVDRMETYWDAWQSERRLPR